jgi:hypothetical protein
LEAEEGWGMGHGVAGLWIRKSVKAGEKSWIRDYIGGEGSFV